MIIYREQVLVRVRIFLFKLAFKTYRRSLWKLNVHIKLVSMCSSTKTPKFKKVIPRVLGNTSNTFENAWHWKAGLREQKGNDIR